MDDRDERIDRANERQLYDALDPLPEGEANPGSWLVRTISGGHYPTSSPSVFKCQLIGPTWTETEGAAVTSVNANGMIYVANITAAVPPAGTLWVAHPISGGRWAMQYSGPT